MANAQSIARVRIPKSLSFKIITKDIYGVVSSEVWRSSIIPTYLKEELNDPLAYAEESARVIDEYVKKENYLIYAEELMPI